MILEKQTESNILQQGDSQESIGMSLDLDSAQVLMQMLSKNLYSDSIGSTIRECASNALDSHRRAGTTDPIIVSYGINKDSNWEFSVEDFGTGLDDDDVRNIISKYGKSTKRNSTTELGMMGLGFKAPLAYSSSFYFTCRKDGVERKYMMYEGEETNAIDLLYEKPTTERNGVKVIIPVKHWDKHSFTDKIKEQLAYFDSVYFHVNGVDNDFTIMRHDHFQWSPMSTDNYLHICLDNVYYPIDFKKLDINTINLPVGLRFSLTDGLFPTPNRESIRYTKEAKDIILKKLGLVADFFINKYNESITDSDDALAILNYYRDSDKYIKSFNNGSLWQINGFSKYSTIQFAKPKLKGVSILDLERIAKHRDNILGEYTHKHSLSNKRFMTVSSRWNSFNYRAINNNETVYVYSDRISGALKDYLRFKHTSHHTVYIVKKEKPFKLGKLKNAGNGNLDTYLDLLDLKKYPRYLWRAVIKEFQYVLSLIEKKFINLDELVIPQSFIDSRKKVKIINGVSSGPAVRRKKLQGEVTGKIAEPLERYVDGRNCKMVPVTIQMENAHRNSKLTIYGGQEHTEQINNLYKLFNGNNVRMIAFSERELKNLKDIDLHNWITMEEFMKGEHKVFKRAATAYLIYKLMQKTRYSFDKRESVIANISTDLSEKMEKLNKYRRNYHLDGGNEIYESILEVAQANNLFDTEMYVIYKEVNALFEKLTFIEPLAEAMPNYRTDERLISALRDLFKYYKHRIDWKYYNIKLNEEVIKPMVESEIEELA